MDRKPAFERSIAPKLRLENEVEINLYYNPTIIKPYDHLDDTQACLALYSPCVITCRTESYCTDFFPAVPAAPLRLCPRRQQHCAPAWNGDGAVLIALDDSHCTVRHDVPPPPAVAVLCSGAPAPPLWPAVRRGDVLVPDDRPTLPAAVFACPDGGRVYLRAGHNHTWLGPAAALPPHYR